jgi:D-ala-D-ala dipeptidase
MEAGELTVYPGEWWHYDGPGAKDPRPIRDVPVNRATWPIATAQPNSDTGGLTPFCKEALEIPNRLVNERASARPRHG